MRDVRSTLIRMSRLDGGRPTPTGRGGNVVTIRGDRINLSRLWLTFIGVSPAPWSVCVITAGKVTRTTHYFNKREASRYYNEILSKLLKTNGGDQCPTA